MKVTSVIPARGNSKGIPLKNIVSLNGEPLISYSIKASLQSNVDETWVSTDSKKIAIISEGYGAKIEMRPSYLADDVIMPDQTLIHFATKQMFDILVFIQPTSPLIKPEYINIGIEMMKTGDYDSLFTVTEEHWLPRWDEDIKPIDWDVTDRPRRQDKQKSFIENGMMYITTLDSLLETELRYGGRKGFIKIPLIDSFQVDTQEDLDLIRKLI